MRFITFIYHYFLSSSCIQNMSWQAMVKPTQISKCQCHYARYIDITIVTFQEIQPPLEAKRTRAEFYGLKGVKRGMVRTLTLLLLLFLPWSTVD